MKALSLMDAYDARIIEVPEPIRTGDNVLLEVNFVGMCGSDLNSYRGRNPLIRYPRILGHEIAATVLEGNSQLLPGTRVTVSPYTSCGDCTSCLNGRSNACRGNETLGVQRDGAATQILSVPHSKVFPSERLSLKELCLVEPLTVGFHAVSRGRITPSDTVAVFGCGGVGLGAIAGAAFLGARVIAIDMDDTKLETAKKSGASETIHSVRQNVRKTLSEMTQGNGPGVILEAIGLPETFRLATEAVSFSGRVVYIGYAKEPVEYETKLFVQKELDIMGSRNALPEDFQRVMAMLEDGKFPVDQVVTNIVPLEAAPSMLAEWSSNPAAFTKILVEIASDKHP